MLRSKLIDIIDENYNIPERDDELIDAIRMVTGLSPDDLDDSDPAEGFYANFDDNELEDILHFLEGTHRGDYKISDLTEKEFKLIKKMLRTWSNSAFTRSESESQIAKDILRKLLR